MLMLFFLQLSVACDGGSAGSRALAVDDFGDTLRTAPYRRIVSLNPSTTEILYAVGGGARLVGRTHYDAAPPEVVRVADLGPGLRPNVEAVLAVRPDLVMLYAGADNRAAARQLRAAGIATLALKIDRVADFQRATLLLGRVLGDTLRSRAVVDSVQATLEHVRRACAAQPRVSVFWPLWRHPLMAVGGGSFLDELVRIAGGANVYGDQSVPAPTVSFEDVLARRPQLLLLTPVDRLHMQADPRWAPWFTAHHVLTIDTALMGQPSVRLGMAAVSLAGLLHPGVVSQGP